MPESSLAPERAAGPGGLLAASKRAFSWLWGNFCQEVDEMRLLLIEDDATTASFIIKGVWMYPSGWGL